MKPKIRRRVGRTQTDGDVAKVGLGPFIATPLLDDARIRDELHVFASDLAVEIRNVGPDASPDLAARPRHSRAL